MLLNCVFYMKNNIARKIEEVTTLLTSDNFNYVIDNIFNLDKQELLILVDYMSTEQLMSLLGKIDKYSKIVFLILNFGSVRVRSVVFNYYNSDNLFDIFNTMSHNELSLLFLNCIKSQREKIIQSFPKIKHIINTRLKNIDSSITSLMDCPIIFPCYWSVEEVNFFLKDNFDISSFYSDIFVYDLNNKLTGRIPIRKMFFHDKNDKLYDLYESEFYSLKEDEEITKKIIDLFIANRIYTMPVIDYNNKILGVLNLDDMLQFIENERKDDLEYLCGISYDEDEGFVQIAIQRGICLLFNFVVALCFLFLVNIFPLPKDISQLYPVVTGLSGAFGIQTVSRSLQKSQNSFTSEMMSALSVGIFYAIFLGVVVLYLNKNLFAAKILPITLIWNFAFASILGLYIPNLSHLIGLDSAFLSGPVLSAVTDIMGLIITYFCTHMFLTYFLL